MKFALNHLPHATTFPVGHGAKRIAMLPYNE